MLKKFFSMYILSLLIFLSLTAPVAPLTAKSSASVRIPILMYHGLTENPKQINDYFISLSTFKSDMKYLKEKGFTPITMTELIDYVYDNNKDTGKNQNNAGKDQYSTGKNQYSTGSDSSPLPQKPVIITFDDGYFNNCKLATPVLKEYGFPAVLSIIGIASDEATDDPYPNEDYINVTWKQVNEMTETGLWEIQNHTWDSHHISSQRRGASQNPNESLSHYENYLDSDLSRLQRKIERYTGKAPNTFTWPFGLYTEEAIPKLKKMQFKAALTCTEGINTVTKGDTDGLFMLKRQLRTPQSSIEELVSREAPAL